MPEQDTRFENCRRGSCKRHQECMYIPCRSSNGIKPSKIKAKVIASPSRVYVISKLKHKDIWSSLGLPISSTWIHGEELPPEECSSMWDRYKAEVESSAYFLLYAQDDDALKGCMLELGMAFSKNLPIIIIWTGSIESLAGKIGTIAYHESVTIVQTLEEAKRIISE